ncbi:MAG: peptidoglycan DD-metalloendopeptidase family protein [Patescibacteria group bacterium]
MLKSFVFICDVLALISRLLSKSLQPLGGFLFKFLVLPAYGSYLKLKNKINKKTSNTRDVFLLFFTNRYLIHVIIFAIAISVSVANVLAYESKENYGQQALIYKITGTAGTEEIEDTNTNAVSDSPAVRNYQNDQGYLAGNLYTESQKREEEVNDDKEQNDMSLTPDLAIQKPNLPDTDVTIRPRNATEEYIVQDGDSIGRVAANFGVSVNTLLWANNLSFSSYIRPGQKIIIPPVSGVIHRVVRGDTIAKIAQKYDADANSIRDFNQLADTGLIIGKSIIVPGGRMIYTTKPRTATNYSTSRPAANANHNQDVVVSSGGRMSWPAGCYRISQYFKGWRHTGVDIACPWGTTIRAADAGRVVRVQYGRTGYGYNVIIDHGGGRQTLYGHLSRIDVAVGEYVQKGEAIGAEGSTGRSTGPHLHFEVRIGGVQVNPLSYIR